MDYKKKFEDFLNKMQGLLDGAKKQGHIIVRVEDIENTFPELKESEDERIRTAILNHLKKMWGNCKDDICGVHVEDAIAWLEKQGVKQSLPIPNEHAWLYLVADVLTWENGIGQYLDDPRVQQLAKELSSEYAQKLYTFPVSSDIENNKQKTDDKIVSKFHEGDWITDGEKVWKIGYIEDDMYIEHHGSISAGGTIESIDKHYHLWTIKDAKDGDVLVDEDNNIGLYREEKDDLDDWESYIYLGCDNRLYGFSMGGYHNIKNTKPATKEQSDLLFQKIKEKGYKWDAEKKALKEIELHDSDKIEPKFKVGEWA